jgi:cholesterol transport system auxiliary component
MRLPWLLPAVAAIVACTILPEPRPYDVYRMPPSRIEASADASVDWSLRITRPASNELLGSSQIPVLPDRHRLIVYEGARWSSPAPVLWRDHLLDAFHNDGRVRRLSTDAQMLKADIELGGMLHAFQAEYHNGDPAVVIRLDAHLVDVADRRILAGRRFEITEPVHGKQVPKVVEAFGRACDRLASEIILWTLQEAGQGR